MSIAANESWDLSVVVVAFVGGNAVASTLQALAPQVEANRVRVVVAYAEGTIDRKSLGERFAFVEWIVAPVGAPPAKLRAVGVAAALGDAPLACTEDHCIPAPDWCAQIIRAHAPGTPVIVGGAIDKATPAHAASWAAYLLDYSRYLPPFANHAQHASDCNVSYARGLLSAVRATWADEFHETMVHDALRARGASLHLSADILVSEERDVALSPYLSERVEHGRLYAAKRSASAGVATRARWAAQSFALPLILIARVVSRIRARRQRVSVPNGAWPALAATAVAWSLGEFLGYFTGRER
ncbi:MAG: hypothetical protein ABIT38_04765 [Gemmatimonadaceae bacterium]